MSARKQIESQCTFASCCQQCLIKSSKCGSHFLGIVGRYMCRIIKRQSVIRFLSHALFYSALKCTVCSDTNCNQRPLKKKKILRFFSPIFQYYNIVVLLKCSVQQPMTRRSCISNLQASVAYLLKQTLAS